MIEIELAEPTHPDFLVLCAALDGYLNILAGGEDKRKQYLPHNRVEDLSVVFLARENDEAIGCAGLKELAASTGEVKRVYIVPRARRHGAGRMLMEAFEKEAVKRGYAQLVLESGAPLKEAMRLYARLGFSVAPPYGPYAEMESSSDSICMVKNLVL